MARSCIVDAGAAQGDTAEGQETLLITAITAQGKIENATIDSLSLEWQGLCSFKRVKHAIYLSA